MMPRIVPPGVQAEEGDVVLTPESWARTTALLDDETIALVQRVIDGRTHLMAAWLHWRVEQERPSWDCVHAAARWLAWQAAIVGRAGRA